MKILIIFHDLLSMKAYVITFTEVFVIYLYPRLSVFIIIIIIIFNMQFYANQSTGKPTKIKTERGN
jgi:uncharacterized membrane protein (UPF0182 family)